MGRKKEIEELQTWLADPNIKTIGIQGLGGIGKSSLAAYLYQKSSFAAKYWADVSQKPDFAAFAEKTIPALGGRVTQTGDTTQLINDLLKCLRQQRCLLVIDNLETLLNEAREFPDSAYQEFFISWLAKGETSTLLVTTQENPQELEYDNNWYRYPLEGMTPADGAELLQKQKIQGTVEELVAFAKSMDGHPLTLELVAGYLRADDNYQLSGVEDLKLQQFDLVYRRAKGLHKNRTLKYVRLEWILQQHLQRLSEEQKNFLVNLSVYRQPFDVRAAEMMLTSSPTPLLLGEGSNLEDLSAKDEGQVVDNSPTKDALWELYNRSLLLKTEDKRYKFQALVQEYLQKQGTDLSAAHEIAIDHYKSQVKPQPWETLEDVRAYLEIFYHLCELKEYAHASDTIDICDNFLSRRGYNKTLVEVYEKMVQVWQTKHREEKNKLAWILINLGTAYNYLGQYKQEMVCHKQAYQIFVEIDNRLGQAVSLRHLGIVYHSIGEYQQAIEYHQQALKIVRGIGNTNEEGETLTQLGNAYNSLRQYQQAIECHQQSLEIAKEIGNRNLESSALTHLGSSYDSIGQYKQALECHQMSLQIERERGNLSFRRGEGVSIGNLGNAYRSLNQYQQAIECYQQHLEIAREISDKRSEAIALKGLGDAYQSLIKYNLAIDYYHQSLTIDREIGHRKFQACSLHKLGNAYFSIRQYQEAISCHQQSLEIERELGNRAGEAISFSCLGDVYQYLKEYNHAINYHQQSLEIKRELGNRAGEAVSLDDLGNAYYSLKQYREAIGLYQKSLEIERELGNRQGECVSLVKLGNTYYCLRQYEEALIFYQQSLEIKREIGDKRGEANFLLNLSRLYYQIGKFQEGFAAAYQANQILQQLRLPLEAMPYPNWMKLIAKFAQRGKFQLALCFILGLFAFPFALVWIVSLMLWRMVRAQFRRRG